MLGDLVRLQDGHGLRAILLGSEAPRVGSRCKIRIEITAPPIADQPRTNRRLSIKLWAGDEATVGPNEHVVTLPPNAGIDPVEFWAMPHRAGSYIWRLMIHDAHTGSRWVAAKLAMTIRP
jgi:hypothetical protein